MDFSSWGKNAASRVQIRFIAILKLPFKFYGLYGRNKPANGERGLRATHNGHQSELDGSRGRCAGANKKENGDVSGYDRDCHGGAGGNRSER